MMDSTLQTHMTWTYDNLEEVERNRAALNIKIGFVFISDKTLVYH